MERTFSMIKPHAYAHAKEIQKMITDAGLRIVASKSLQMTVPQAQEFYAEHKGKDFFDGVIDMMTSGPVIVQVLEGENAIKHYREVMGATNPAKAAPGTIRAAFGEELPYNAAHGSDSPESAGREMHFFFTAAELGEN